MDQPALATCIPTNGAKQIGFTQSRKSLRFSSAVFKVRSTSTRSSLLSGVGVCVHTAAKCSSVRKLLRSKSSTRRLNVAGKVRSIFNAPTTVATNGQTWRCNDGRLARLGVDADSFQIGLQGLPLGERQLRLSRTGSESPCDTNTNVLS